MYFSEDGSGSVVALDAGNNLWLFTKDSMSGQLMAQNVVTFLVDSAGSVLAFQPTSGESVGNACPIQTGGEWQESITGSFKQVELDGSGSVVALDTSGNLERFAPEADVAPADGLDAAIDGAPT